MHSSCLRFFCSCGQKPPMNTTALTGEFNFWTSVGIWAPLLDSHLGSSRLKRSDGLVGWTKVDFAKQLVDKRCNSRAIVKCSASKLTLPFHPCSVTHCRPNGVRSLLCASNIPSSQRRLLCPLYSGVSLSGCWCPDFLFCMIYGPQPCFLCFSYSLCILLLSLGLPRNSEQKDRYSLSAPFHG